MAAAKPFLSTDLYSCSVCLEVLKEPVTIPCGHSYCLQCINKHWDRSGLMGSYNCPQCRMDFHPRPQLHQNTTLTNLIQDLKKEGVIRDPPQKNAGPGNLSCDVCPGKKWKASKTCMASFCKTQLKLRLESQAFGRHKLDEPTRYLEEKLCSKHQRVLEMFCRTDESLICSVCAITEHKSHDIRTLEEETAERKCQLVSKAKEVKRRILEKETKVAKLKKFSKTIQKSAKKKEQEHEETINALLQSIERLTSEVSEVIRDHERREVRKAEELINILGKDIEVLQSREAKMAEFSKIDDHIHFLKRSCHVCVPPADGNAPNITVRADFLPETQKKKLSGVKRSLQKITGKEFVKSKKTICDISSDVPKKLNRNDLLKYSCPLTLDPNTAHRRLHLSEGIKQVTCMGADGPYPDHPDRFDSWPQVLCSEALSGPPRHYWEVEWSGQGVDVGVTYKRIRRQGAGNDCLLGFNDNSWSLICCDSNFSVWHNVRKTEISAPFSHRIGVFLDYAGGSLSFYSISDTMTLLHKFNASFTEPLYAGFRIRENSSLVICPLKQSDQ
ncbi:E3 ubiquitin/ISG15 ligase TRIM25-like [Erpetoichthys calabaricus]|uniref:E3 ubiquitin/ISG15 ligase TRIM25-like n=1 Tax=Erpetoichthys calabaricus TaxID=27687 RepID=UPI0022341C03|nr:E3 ubiquitin/ISG15 ligase TRIM25-like [Erpetoichthys calabaricus]